MELLFEARLEIRGIEGKLYFVQPKPIVHPQPVLEPDPDSLVDGGGVTVEGTVLKDGGILRMWYNAWPKDWDGQNVNLVGYAESEDGLSWRRPVLNLLEIATDPTISATSAFACPASLLIPPRRPPTATGQPVVSNPAPFLVAYGSNDAVTTPHIRQMVSFGNSIPRLRPGIAAM